MVFLSSGKELLEAVEPFVRDGAGLKRLIDAASSLARDWPGLERPKVRDLILSIILRIDIHPERVDIQIAPARLTGVLRDEPSDQLPPDEDAPKAKHLTLTVPACLKRTGMEMKMLVDGEARNAGKADRSLVRLIVKAHAFREKLESKGIIDASGMTRRFGTGRAYYTRLLRLSLLAPDITKAILEGRHPKDLTAARLMRSTRFPLSWREQRESLGFA